MTSSPFITLTALGEIYGVNAREVGGWLKGLGLREADGRPSREAVTQGFILERTLNHGGYFWLWHKDKTCNELDMMGYPRDEPSPVGAQPGRFILIQGE